MEGTTELSPLSPAVVHVHAAAANEEGDRIKLSDDDFKFSVDLIELSKCHVTFLRTCHAANLTQTRPSANQFRRYTELWLPLAAAHQGRVNRQTAAQPLFPYASLWVTTCTRKRPPRCSPT